MGIAGFVLLAVVGVAFADDTTPQAPPQDQATQQPAAQQTPAAATKSEKDPLDEIECRKETTIGSRIGGKRVCKTRREWMQIQRDSQAALQKIQDKGGYNNPTSAGGN